MGKLLSTDGKISKRQMSARSEDASLRFSHFGDEVRDLEVKILCIGYYIAPRHRAEFTRVLKYLQDELPLDAASIRCVSICLDILRERYAAPRRGAA
jgi:hypothetical protein